jgi:hypothetical protein
MVPDLRKKKKSKRLKKAQKQNDHNHEIAYQMKYKVFRKVVKFTVIQRIHERCKARYTRRADGGKA